MRRRVNFWGTMLYLISGRDEFRREEFVAQLKTLMRRLPMGEHNILELESSVSLQDLMASCDTVPFLCEKRMVIAEGLVAQLTRGGQAPTELTAYLSRLPATTHLVLVEEDDALLQLLAGVRSDTVRRHFPRLHPDALPRWIAERARKYGAHMAPAAAELLAELTGPDLHLLDREIAKLAAYEDPEQPIGLESVRQLAHGAGPEVFALHDALAERRTAAALAALQGLLDRGEEPAELFAHVAGLMRRLLVVKELSQQGQSVARQAPSFGLTTSSYAQDKLRRQAARLTTGQLERAYELLHETDVAIKTGQLDAEVALQLVVAQLAGIDPAPAFSASQPP